MLAIAYAAALGSAAGVSVVAVAAPIAAFALWRSSPVIEVGPQGVAAGRALLPIDAVGSVRVLHEQELSAARRGFDPQIPIASFMVVPPWSPRAAVAIVIDDDTDPHGSWVVASRHAGSLAEHIAQHIAQEVNVESDGSRDFPESPDSPDSPDSPTPG